MRSAAQLLGLLTCLVLIGCEKPGLQRTAAAYRALGQGLLKSGLLPFPADAKDLEATVRRTFPFSTGTIRQTSDSRGRTVWQVSQFMTVTTHANGKPERYLVIPAKWPVGDEVGKALRVIMALARSEQQPAQVGGSGQMASSQFYFTYTKDSHAWRFTPTFSGEQCIRVDVEQVQ